MPVVDRGEAAGPGVVDVVKVGTIWAVPWPDASQLAFVDQIKIDRLATGLVFINGAGVIGLAGL